ncbi:hypothetical protein QT231_22390 [Halomonas sp. SpR1]|uniref:hypothetical protein n=1 Tax=Halomonas sp. SpR1 TaxID=3050462 RepID=UPI0027E48490|nr:hypothetical protein [Halomonas sp. SpR1]MDQ7735460.1 hypothetical protein [Halomonas sp. SpR1]
MNSDYHIGVQIVKIITSNKVHKLLIEMQESNNKTVLYIAIEGYWYSRQVNSYNDPFEAYKAAIKLLNLQGVIDMHIDVAPNVAEVNEVKNTFLNEGITVNNVTET